MIFSLLQIYIWSLLASIMLGVVIQLAMSFVLTQVWVETLISTLRRTPRQDNFRAHFLTRISGQARPLRMGVRDVKAQDAGVRQSN